MNRSIGAEADAETEYEPIGKTRNTSAETVTVTLAASPLAETLTFDVIDPAEPSITAPATEPGSPAPEAAAIAASCAAAWVTCRACCTKAYCNTIQKDRSSAGNTITVATNP
jgi:hypothetical protein